MASVVILDSCVLYPLPLRDTLLRAAEAELFVPAWSERILDEVRRNLVADGRANREQAQRLIKAMNSAFDAAMVAEPAISQIEPRVSNHPKDRHVLAAAVACDAEALVTFDLNHFPASSCDPYAIETFHPDDFLTDLHHRHPAVVRAALERQAAALTTPPLGLADVLARLETTVPEFAEAVAAAARQ